MPLNYPKLHIESGDELYAEPQREWGHVSNYIDQIDDAGPITIKFYERPSPQLSTGSDNFDAMVNGERENVHIDFIGDIFALAERLEYNRFVSDDGV